MLQPVEDLDLPERSLAVGLVLEGRDLLDGHLFVPEGDEGNTGDVGKGNCFDERTLLKLSESASDPGISLYFVRR